MNTYSKIILAVLSTVVILGVLGFSLETWRWRRLEAGKPPCFLDPRKDFHKK